MMCLYRSSFALQRFLAVILALFPSSCGNSMSPLLSSFFQGFGCRGMASCLSLWDAGLTEEAERMAAFGDLGCRAAGDRERVGRGGFPPWLDQPLCTPSSLFWVLEKGTGSSQKSTAPCATSIQSPSFSSSSKGLPLKYCADSSVSGASWKNFAIVTWICDSIQNLWDAGRKSFVAGCTRVSIFPGPNLQL